MYEWTDEELTCNSAIKVCVLAISNTNFSTYRAYKELVNIEAL